MGAQQAIGDVQVRHSWQQSQPDRPALCYDATMEDDAGAQLFKAAMLLSDEERRELALTLLHSVGSGEDAATIEREWKAEVARRLAALRADSTLGVPWDQARNMMFPR